MSEPTQDVPPISLNNTTPMADDTVNGVTSHAALWSDNQVLAVANGKTASRYFLNGVAQNGTPNTGDIVEWIQSVSTDSSGNANYYITSTGVSSGAALLSSIFADSVQTQLVDSANLYAQGIPTVTSSKTIVVPITKQAFTGISVVGINVLGAQTMGTAPSGVTVKLRVVGVSV